MNKTSTQTSVKKSRPAKRNRGLFWLMVLLFLLFLTFGCGVISYNFVIKSTAEAGKQKQIVISPEDGKKFVLPKGSNTAKIADLLKSEGFISTPGWFKFLSKMNGYDGQYRSGTHILSNSLSYDEMMRVLSSKPASIKVTIPEGKSFMQIVDMLYQEKVIADKGKFIQLANSTNFDYEFLKGHSPRDNKLEGYLFPDTYEFDMNSNDKDVLVRMLDNFRKKMTSDYLERVDYLKREKGMSLDKVIILASIIEREAKKPDDRYTISGVFYNRMNSRDKSLRKLQSCATIQYILLKKNGEVKERLSEEDLALDDPYNTYKYEGLPPGPICCPGEAAIKAAMYPDDETNYLYFVAKGDGTHQFSKTYKEHQAAIVKYGLR